MRIENWSVTMVPDSPYDAPELWRARLRGMVYGHPKFEDGAHVTTSHIVAAAKREVGTATGHTYTLGVVNPRYQDWVEKTGEWREDEPIRIVEDR